MGRTSILHRIITASIRHAWLVVAAFVALTTFFAWSMTRIRMSPDVETLLPEGDSVGQLMEKYGGGADIGEVLVVAARGEDLFTLDQLAAFGRLTDSVEALDEVDPGITPFNMLAIERSGPQIRPVPLSPGRVAPTSSEDLAVFQARIRSSPLARNLVISGDGTVLLAIYTCRTLDYAGLMDRVRGVVAENRGPLDVIISGSVPFLERTGVYLARDLSTLLGLAALIIVASYYLGFRSLRGVVLPLIVVAVGTVWCLGFMSLVGLSLTVVTIVIPPLVLTLGSSYAIHILNQYYRDAGERTTDRSWIADAVVHINRTILIAAATTTAGLLGLLSVSLKQIWHFAIGTSFGILSCALLSLFLLPATLARLGPPAPKQRETVLSGGLTRSMASLASGVIRFRYPILALVVLLGGAFALTANRLEFTTDTISYFPQRDPVVRDMYFLTGKVGGFDEVNVTLLAPDGQSGYFLRPEALAQVSRFEQRLRDLPDVGYVASFVTYRDYVDGLFPEDGEGEHERTRVQLLARVFKALSANESIARYLRIMADETFTRLTLSLRIFNSRTGKFVDEKGLRAVLADMGRIGDSTLDPAIRRETWGSGLRFLSVADTIRPDLVKSILVSLATVLMIVSVAFRSLRFGVLTLVPLLVGLVLSPVLMVLFSIPLDATTFMVSSVTTGVGVDDSIHFLLQFRRQRKENPDDLRRALTNTMTITGRPILLTSATVSVALTVFLFSSFKPIVYFGLLVILSLSTTCIATLVVLPALLTVLNRLRGARAGATRP